MIKRALALTVALLLVWMMFDMLINWNAPKDLSGVAREYVEKEPHQLGAVNVVTAIVVTYRGFDTLGEVTVLFLAATGVAVLLSRRKKEPKPGKKKYRPASEFLNTGTHLLSPFIVMFGAYIFLNGHLSPGGGFQGGAVIASGVLFLFLVFPNFKLNHLALNWLESTAGASYVLVGLLGLFLAAGFLDNRFLPLGHYGALLSAGAIPVIYTFIGLKVGTELSGILENLKN